MALLTPTEAIQLNKQFPLAAKLRTGDRLRAAESLQMAGRVASSHARLNANANDTDTVTVTVGGVSTGGVALPGSTRVYEFDTGGAITAGRVLVTIGGTAALSATALAAAIRANQGTVVSAVAHAVNTTVVDVAHRVQGGTLSLATASGGRIVVQNNAGQLAAAAQALYSRRRVVTAEDVTRTRIIVNTGLSALDSYTVRLVTSATDNTPVAWNGTITATGGVLELSLGATPFAAGHVVEVMAIGTAP